MVEHITKEKLWAEIQEQQTPVNTGTPATDNSEDFPGPDEVAVDENEIDLARLRSALSSLDPDADDDRTWLAHRIGPLVNAAKARPDLEGDLFALAWNYSSGK